MRGIKRVLLIQCSSGQILSQFPNGFAPPRDEEPFLGAPRFDAYPPLAMPRLGFISLN
jgi:hypothetical protein